jgi:hypothetical protein
MNAKTVPDFLREVQAVPWFSNLGQPIPESNVPRIYKWDEWPGPLDDEILECSLRQQRLYDQIMGPSEAPETLQRIWDDIHALVFRDAAPKVRFDPLEDAWHAPSAAVWHAAWTAGLIGLCLQTGHPIPDDLQEQWQWFLKGHWPSGYASLKADGEPGPLLVF